MLLSSTARKPGLPRFTLCPIVRRISGSRRVSAPASEALLKLSQLKTEDDHALARAWAATFERDDIPKTAWEATYSRSSGAGGQHVNRTSSKASVRCSLQQTGTWLPRFVMIPLAQNPHYLANPPSLLVSSQQTRSAPENLQHALTILHRTILGAAHSTIQGETSQDTKARVVRHIEADKAKRRKMKEIQSRKTADRKKPKFD